jgi:hypothetical protein
MGRVSHCQLVPRHTSEQGAGHVQQSEELDEVHALLLAWLAVLAHVGIIQLLQLR